MGILLSIRALASRHRLLQPFRDVGCTEPSHVPAEARDLRHDTRAYIMVLRRGS